MDERRAKRLEEKYKSSSSAPQKKQIELRAGGGGGGAARTRAMSGAKPKNIAHTVKRLMVYLAHERFRLILGIFIGIFHTAAMLTGTYSMRGIINKYVATGDVVNLAKALGVLGVVYILSVSSQIIAQRLMLSLSQRTLRRLRGELYSKLQKLPVRYFDTHSTGDIMSRFTNDVDTLGELLNSTIIQIAEGVLTLTGISALMLYTNPLLALVTLFIAPVIIFSSRVFIKRGRTPYAAQQRSLGMLNGYAEEMISAQKVIKVFNHEDAAMDEFNYINDTLCETQIKAQFLSSIMNPFTHNLCNLDYALTACIGGIFVITGGLDIGGLTVFVNYTRQFQRPINEVSNQMNTIFSALAGTERVFEILDEIEEAPDIDTVPLEVIEGNVVLENVSFGYEADKIVLHDISLYAKPGQKIAFVGATGAGKTTVTNLLTRFYDIQQGTITIDNVPIEKIDRAFLRKNIAMVLQDTHLFTGTVMENIRYGRKEASDDQVITAAKAAYAHSFIMNLENGYETMLENDGANLSQGQRQLLNIARAAISNAPILILDEATSSVDTRTEKYIERGMDELMKNRTTFVIAHRLSTVRQSDAIMVLEKGRIIERGNHFELLEMGGVYADLYNEIARLE
ncbi:MAG: ABC transporter ATP-binding protein [Eubacteriaceae bacterium]|nr:ABC transporter ATP-binding protein [Eubacteriaceae bacterium]